MFRKGVEEGGEIGVGREESAARDEGVGEWRDGLKELRKRGCKLKFKCSHRAAESVLRGLRKPEE